MIKVGLIDDIRFQAHEQEPGHPESPERVLAIRRALTEAGLSSRMQKIEARPASREELLLLHTPEYVDFVEHTCLDVEPEILGPDVTVCKGSWPAALLAAGSAIEAVRAVLDERSPVQRVFGNIRPPGHHALASQAMGFCIFNNVALAAKWALEHAGLNRVAILDWDVHHGNGSQDAFWGEKRVFYASFHQYPFYPGSGAHSEGNIHNFPMPAGSGDKEYLTTFKERLVPAMDTFRPQLLLISCGFDAHKKDPLAGINLTESAYEEMTRMACSFAGGKVVSLLEGGYDLDAIAASACAHVRALLET